VNTSRDRPQDRGTAAAAEEQVGTVDRLAFRLAQLGCDLTVHEPAEPVDHLLGLSTRITHAGAPAHSSA
jgi:hypothetical protein